MSADNSKTLADIGHEAWYLCNAPEGLPAIPLSSRAPEYQAAWHAAADASVDHVIGEVFHEEQLQIWSDELLADLGAYDYIKDPASYDDVVHMHKVIQDFMSKTVARRIRSLKRSDKENGDV